MAITTEAASSPLSIALSTDQTLPAARYKQGGRTVYQLALTPAEITTVIPRPDPVIPR